jgi:hypothetical protein
MGRNRYALVAVVAFIVIIGGWALLRTVRLRRSTRTRTRGWGTDVLTDHPAS